MGLWLGLDTATDSIGLALVGDGEVVDETIVATRRGHTVQLAPSVAAALERHQVAASDLAGIGVAIGPGSYTGLRVGLAVAKGLSLAVGAPVVGVPTLDALAAGLSPPDCPRAGTLWAVLKAGRGRIVAAAYPPRQPWPSPEGLVAEAVEEWLLRTQPGEWCAGELAPEARRLAGARGLTVLSEIAGTRRPAWIARLAAERTRVAGEGREREMDLAAVSELCPVYPVTARHG